MRHWVGETWKLFTFRLILRETVASQTVRRLEREGMTSFLCFLRPQKYLRFSPAIACFILKESLRCRQFQRWGLVFALCLAIEVTATPKHCTTRKPFSVTVIHWLVVEGGRTGRPSHFISQSRTSLAQWWNTQRHQYTTDWGGTCTLPLQPTEGPNKFENLALQLWVAQQVWCQLNLSFCFWNVQERRPGFCTSLSGTHRISPPMELYNSFWKSNGNKSQLPTPQKTNSLDIYVITWIGTWKHKHRVCLFSICSISSRFQGITPVNIIPCHIKSSSCA